MSRYKSRQLRDAAYQAVLDQMSEEKRAETMGRPTGQSSARIRQAVRVRQGKRNGR